MNENQQKKNKEKEEEVGKICIYEKERDRNLGFICFMLNYLQVTSKLELNTKLTTSSFMNSIHGIMH